MYILKTYDDRTLELTASEAVGLLQAINDGKQKGAMLRGQYFAFGDIRRIADDDVVEENNDHKIGVLHDGTRVVRQFGEWFCMDGSRDEAGRYEVRPSSRHYPEVAMDCVPSVETFEKKYRQLPLEERKTLICGGRDISRYTENKGFTRIGEHLAPALLASDVSDEKHNRNSVALDGLRAQFFQPDKT